MKREKARSSTALPSCFPLPQATPFFIFRFVVFLFFLRYSESMWRSWALRRSLLHSPRAVTARGARVLRPGAAVCHAMLRSRRCAATATESNRRDDDDNNDAGSRIINEPQMTLGCFSFQVPRQPSQKKKAPPPRKYISTSRASNSAYDAKPAPGFPHMEI